MNKIMTSFLLSVILISGYAQQTPNPNPSCSNPIGIWHNDLKSSLIIESINAGTGQVMGKYISPSGGGQNQFALIGWVNEANANPQHPNNAKVITFTVRWGNIGSITSWTGTCSVVNGKATIATTWNIARPNSDFSWDHILTGSDQFTPGAP